MLKKHTNAELIVPIERIESQICFLRGEKVMLDADLAKLYQGETKPLNRAVKRIRERFCGDFLFQLTHEELEVPNWHLKRRQWRPPLLAIRFHGTRRRHALFRT